MPVSRQQIYDALTTEDNYARAWSKGKKSKVEGVEDHMVSRRTGLPFSEMDWVTFAELYLNEAKTGTANFVPDIRAIHVRLLKAASMIIAAIQTQSTPEELASYAGHSRTEFPVMGGGLKTFKEMQAKNPTTGDAQ
jgi:hypothetical protein